MAISRISDRKESLRTFSGVQAGSVYFDGTGDYITTPSTGAFQFEKDFTIECWIYPTNLSVAPTIWSAGTETTNRFNIALNSSGQLLTNLYGSASTTYTVNILANQWTHVAVVRYGSTVRIFVNGIVSTVTETQSGTIGNGTFRIGADSSGTAGFLGYISNLRIVKDVAVYYGNFTPPTAPLSFDTTTASVYFNGSNYLNLPTTQNTNFDWVASNTTIETWIFPQSVSSFKSIISKNALNNTNNDWDLYLDSAGKLNWYYFNGGVVTLTSTTAVSLNTWSHIAFVYNKSSQQINLFINGANTAGAAYVPTRDLQSSALKIGASNSGAVFPTQAYFEGYMSQLRIVQNDSPIAYASNFTPSLVPLTAIPGTKLLTCQASTIKDNSPLAQRIDATGASVSGLSSTSDGYYSYYFDGTGDYVQLADANGAQFGTEDFTIEMWIYQLNAGSAYPLIDFRSASGATFGQIYINTDRTLHFYLPTDVATTNTITLNTWQHIAIVRESGLLKMFINGAIGYNASQTGTFNASKVRIGADVTGSPGFPGYISNLRIVRGNAVYTQNFIPPRLPLQPTQAIVDPRSKPEISKSLYFDGNGDYLSLSSNPNLSGSSFTIEAWVYLTAYSPSYTGNYAAALISADTSSNGFEIAISGTASSYTNLVFFSRASSSTTNNISKAFNFSLNTWYHIALVSNGTTLNMYVNGTSIGTNSITTWTETGGLYVGFVNVTNFNYYFPGYISNLRIVKGAAVYTGNTFAVPSAPLEISQTPSANIAAIYNYPTIPSTGYSAYFDGNGDYITGAAPNMGGTWTIEFWMYPTVNGTQQTIVSFNAGSFSGINIWRNSSNQLVVDDGVNAQSAGTAVIATNAWSHIAVSRSGTTTKAYVNGVLALTNTFTPATVTTVMIGRYNASPFYYFTGYISNFRLIDGKALYSTDFLPDLTPLTKFGSLNSATNTNVLGITTIPEKGYSAYFDGTGDYVSTTASSAFRNDLGDWTAECWLYAKDLSENKVFACMGLFNSAVNWTLYVTPLGSIRYEAGNGSTWTAAADYGSSNGIISTNSWYHVAYVRTGSTLSIYVNGAKVLYQTSATFGVGATNGLFIGSYYGSSSKNWIGYVSNFRFIKDQALYIGPFTPPSAPLTITQSASSNVAALYSYTSTPSTGRSVYFDGTGDYLSATLTAQSPGSGDFTYECWFNVSSISSFRGLWNTRSGDTTDGFDIYVKTSGQIEITYTSTVLFTSSATVTTNSWNHIAVVRLGTTWTIFLNGLSIGTITNSTNFTSTTLYIGAAAQALSLFLGYISNFRYVKGQALYTSEFTPDRAPLTAITNTSLLTCQSSTIIDNSVNGFAITAVGDAAVNQLSPFANTVTLLTLQGNTFVDSSANAFTITPAGDTKIFKTFSPFGNTATILTLQSNTIVDSGEGNITLTVNGDIIVSNANPFTNTTVLLTAQSNAIVDNSNYKFTLTRTGDVAVKELSPFGSIIGEIINTIPENGNSILFDGSGDYITIPYNPSFNIPASTPFSLEAWVYHYSASEIHVVNRNWAYGSTGPTYGFGVGNDMKPFWGIAGTGSSTYNMTAAGTAGTVGKWNHYAWTRDANNVCRIYTNGLEATSITRTDSQAMSASSGSIYIGVSSNLASPYANGRISNIRFVIGTCAYTGNFTVPTAPVSMTQNSSSNISAIVNTIPENGYSGFFDQSGDYIDINSKDFAFGADNFTIEMWVHPTVAPSTSWNPILTLGFSGGGQEIRISQNINGTGYGYLIPNNTNNGDVYQGFGTLTLNQWHHLALVRNGSTVTLFRNGVNVGSTTGVSFNFTNNTLFRIGGSQAAYPDGSFGGYISNFRIIRGTAVYTGNFTTPTAPLTTYQAPSANVIQAGTPIGGKSIYLDGTGDYVRAGPLQGGLGARDFTVEGWVKLVSNMRSNDGIFHISKGNYSPSTSVGLALAQLNNQFSIYINGLSTTAAGTANVGPWYHFALTRANTSSRLFINGSLVQGPYTDTTDYTDANYVSLGYYYNTGYTMNGHLNNFRIVQGNALYTTTFTPSTSPLTITANANTLLLIQDSFTDSSPRKLDVTKFGDAKIVSDNPFGNVVSLLTLQSPTFADNSANSIANLFTLYGDTAMTKTMSPFGSANVKLLIAQANAITSSNLVIENSSGYNATKFGNVTVSLVESPFGYANTKLLTLQSLFPIDKSAANNTITLTGDARANVLANVSNPFRVHNVIPSNVSLLTLNSNTIIDTSFHHAGGPWTLTVSGDTKTAVQSPFGYATDTSASMTRSYKTKTFTRRAYEKNTKTNRQFMFANGGAFSTTTDGTYIYNVHVFLESNTLTVLSAPGAIPNDNRINFLVVGGGGAGGSATVDPASPYAKGGGGGAGGFIDAIHYVKSNVQYTMVVGGGGSRNGPPAATGSNGGDSTISAPPADTTFDFIKAWGGGGGGGASGGVGAGGGSGGGAAGPVTTGTGLGPAIQASYGSRFGPMAGDGLSGGWGWQGGPIGPSIPKANPTGATGSGGGGAGGFGGLGPNAAGAPGLAYQIGPPAAPHPYSTIYAGGGGGAAGGAGGAGGGAPGRNSPNAAPTNPAGGINTGGGGGGGTAQGPNGPFSTAGGSGIIIAWYKAGYVNK